MRHKQGWALLALLLGACAIPKMEIDEGPGGRSGATSTGGTNSSRGGSSSGTGEAGDGASGEPTEGGSSNNAGSGGTPSSGGNPPTGGTSPTGGGGGSGGSTTPPRAAVAKFCNAVVVGGEPVVFDLAIGSGDDVAHIGASSGTCSPPQGRNCVSIPTGAAVPVRVMDLNDNVLYETTERIVPGQSWIFALYYDENIKDAVLDGDSGITASECAAADFDELFGSP